MVFEFHGEKEKFGQNESNYILHVRRKIENTL